MYLPNRISDLHIQMEHNDRYLLWGCCLDGAILLAAYNINLLALSRYAFNCIPDHNFQYSGKFGKCMEFVVKLPVDIAIHQRDMVSHFNLWFYYMVLAWSLMQFEHFELQTIQLNSNFIGDFTVITKIMLIAVIGEQSGCAFS